MELPVKKRQSRFHAFQFRKRPTGIEPASEAWEAPYYHCTTTAKIFISLLLRRIGFKHPDKTFYHQCKIFCLYSVINYVITALDQAVGAIRINSP